MMHAYTFTIIPTTKVELLTTVDHYWKSKLSNITIRRGFNGDHSSLQVPKTLQGFYDLLSTVLVVVYRYLAVWGFKFTSLIA